MPCALTSSTSAASSSAVHLSRLMLGLTCCGFLGRLLCGERGRALLVKSARARGGAQTPRQGVVGATRAVERDPLATHLTRWSPLQKGRGRGRARGQRRQPPTPPPRRLPARQPTSTQNKRGPKRTLWRQRCAHCWPVRPGMWRATSDHLLPSLLWVVFCVFVCAMQRWGDSGGESANPLRASRNRQPRGELDVSNANARVEREDRARAGGALPLSSRAAVSPLCAQRATSDNLADLAGGTATLRESNAIEARHAIVFTRASVPARARRARGKPNSCC